MKFRDSMESPSRKTVPSISHQTVGSSDNLRFKLVPVPVEVVICDRSPQKMPYFIIFPSPKSPQLIVVPMHFLVEGTVPPATNLCFPVATFTKLPRQNIGIFRDPFHG